jgi:hypothetical protein
MDDQAKQQRSKLEADAADWSAQYLGERLDSLAPGADMDIAIALLRGSWVFGHTPPISSTEQYDSYARQRAEIYEKAGGEPKNDEEIRHSLQTQEGVQAMAILARMLEWQRAGH